MKWKMPESENCCRGVLDVARLRFLDLGRREDGAALVMTLAVFMLMYFVCIAVFSVSTQVKEKIHLQNACDAAAYSAAVVQADTFSRVATINRAMAWTYVQMTRRQMDYIVYKWLDCTYAHYKKDEETARNNHGCIGICTKDHYDDAAQWNIKANSSPLAGRGTVQLNGSGITSVPLGSLLNLGSIEQIENVGLALNLGGAAAVAGVAVAGDPLSLTSISQQLYLPAVQALASASPWDALEIASLMRLMGEFANSDESMSAKLGYSSSAVTYCMNVLRTQVLSDRVNIAAMNIFSRRLVRTMPGKIDKCVEDILRANVPQHMLSECRYQVRQNRDPLSLELVGGTSDVGALFGGYFCNMRNTKEDEAKFLRFAGYDKGPVETFREASLLGGTLAMTAGGVDQWFVRGDGTKRTHGAIGLQRSYKHWAEGPRADKHMAYNPYLPSCFNVPGEGDDDVPETVALHSQWQWFARQWFCLYIPPTIYNPEFDIHVPIPLWPTCEFHSKPGLDLLAGVGALLDWVTGIGDVLEAANSAIDGYDADADDDDQTEAAKTKDEITEKARDYQEGPAVETASTESSPVDEYEYGCLVTSDIENPIVMNIVADVPVPVPLFAAYARIYADDKHLYNQCYVGERARPLIMRTNYFGKDGTIAVGLARKNENVWKRILQTVAGYFRAFDPTVDWTWTFSAAKAGYRDKDAAADLRDYRVDWQFGNQEWNMCQDDWDAVFVPVRQSETLALSSLWTLGSKNFLNGWLADSWQPLMDRAPETGSWDLMPAPAGFSGESGRLDWGRLTDVMYH